MREYISILIKEGDRTLKREWRGDRRSGRVIRDRDGTD